MKRKPSAKHPYVEIEKHNWLEILAGVIMILFGIGLWCVPYLVNHLASSMMVMTIGTQFFTVFGMIAFIVGLIFIYQNKYTEMIPVKG